MCVRGGGGRGFHPYIFKKGSPKNVAEGIISKKEYPIRGESCTKWNKMAQYHAATVTTYL